MKKEDAKSMIERVRKCEENAQRVSDPFLREAYARFASYWKRKARAMERRDKSARRIKGTRSEFL